MLAEMELRGLSETTRKSYLICCRVFVAHFMRSPEQLGAQEIGDFLLHLIRDRRAGPSLLAGLFVATGRL